MLILGATHIRNAPNTVLLSNLSHQRDSTVPYRTATHRTAPKRNFSKMPLHLNVTFLTHRNMQRYIEKYAVVTTVKVTLDVTVRVMRFIICNDASNAYKIL